MRKRLFALSVLTGMSVALQAQSTQSAGQQSGTTSSQSQTTQGQSNTQGQSSTQGQRSRDQGTAGQTTTTGGQTPTTGTQTTTIGSTNAGGQQSYAGVLMDASCAVIASNTRAGTPGSSTGVNTYSGSTSTTAATGATGTGTTGEGNTTITGTSRTTDVAAARSTTEAGAQTQRDTASTTAGRTTAGTPTAGTTTPGTTTAGTTAGAAGTTGERSRTGSDPATSASFTTVREKYRDCMVKPTTTSFAIHSDGRLIVLDESANQMVRQQVTSDQFRSAMTDASGNPKWMSVTLNGSMQGDRLSVTSVQR